MKNASTVDAVKRQASEGRHGAIALWRFFFGKALFTEARIGRCLNTEAWQERFYAMPWRCRMEINITQSTIKLRVPHGMGQKTLDYMEGVMPAFFVWQAHEDLGLQCLFDRKQIGGQRQ